MSLRKSEKWLLLQLGNGSRIVMNSRSVTNPHGEAKIGAVVTSHYEGNPLTATIIGSSRDRQLLEDQITPKLFGEDIAGPSLKNEESKDFSASASDWEPSDEQVSTTEDEEEVESKKAILDRYMRSYPNRRASKILKPCHRAEAINVSINKNKKRKCVVDNWIATAGKPIKSIGTIIVPDSTRQNNGAASINVKSDTISIDLRELQSMKEKFRELFNILNLLKPAQPPPQEKQIIRDNENNVIKKAQATIKKERFERDKSVNNEEESEESHISRSEDLNRSDDNVLITNKYDVENQNKRVYDDDCNNQANSNQETTEWIPIGSGKTLIHKDQFRKVNWKSYTIATRTLLLAAFPRKILATHSLTGKRSPAFQNKPPKMCLDPKIVTDVIIEITDRFKVKENLVRTIITTKCADEAKMFKMRLKRKTMPSKNKENSSLGYHDEVNNITF